MFSNARNFDMPNGTFVVAGGDCIIRERSSSEIGWAKLENYVATGAMHDSAERSDAPRCHPETRVAVQSDIMSWITYGDTLASSDYDSIPKNVMWVTGPAGTGKTAILSSISEVCHERRTLAASFFFSCRHAGRNSKHDFVPTLAYQLGLSIKHLRPLINDAVQEDGTVFSKNVKTQFNALILTPVLRLSLDEGVSSEPWPKAIVIDALDECGPTSIGRSGSSFHNQQDREDDHFEILSTILSAVSHPSFPFRVLIASRPERVIRQFFKNDAKPRTRVLVLDERYNPDADIALLFRCKFSDLRRQYAITAIWPPENTILILVDKASGQFIYAATVLRFLQNPRRSPQEQLNTVLGIQIGPINKEENPFAQLDALYTAILQSSPDPLQSMLWLHLIDYFSNVPQYEFSSDYNSFARQSLRGMAYPASFVNAFLESDLGDAERFLGNLHSILHVPDVGDIHSPYSFYHKSLLEFMKHPLRSKEVYIREDTWRAHLFRRYLAVYPTTPSPSVEDERFLTLCGNLTIFDHLRFLLDPAFDNVLLDYDIAWWTRHQMALSQIDNINLFYRHIHSRCTWFRCTKPCHRWRKGITKAFERAGLVVPSKIHHLHNRVQRTLVFDFGTYSDKDVTSLHLAPGAVTPEAFYSPSSSTTQASFARGKPPSVSKYPANRIQ